MSQFLPAGCVARRLSIPLALWLGAAATDVVADDAEAAWAARSASLDRLHSVLVLEAGEPILERVRAGPGLDAPASIKSLSKTVLSALAGIAIDRGVVESVDQSILELLSRSVQPPESERLERITFGHALSLRTGLRSTSGRYYGAWVQSDDWVGHVLSRPFVDEPGGEMIYSTGSTHLVSAAIAARSGRSTLALARDWLGEPLDIRIPDWMTDPQGIHFGGNQMLLSPRALAKFGETYRCGGRFEGRQVVPEDWVRASWTSYGTSPWSGDDYGYGWFITELAGHAAYYGRGYGGQALIVVPSVAMTIVITSDPEPPSRGSYFERIKRLAAEIVGGRGPVPRRSGC